MKKQLLFLFTILCFVTQTSSGQQCRDGNFTAQDPVTYPCSGVATLLFSANGNKEVNFTNFNTVQGFNVEVFLSSDDDLNDGSGSSMIISTAPLTADNGSSDPNAPVNRDLVFDVSSVPNINDYSHVIIQCTQFNVQWGNAPLGMVETNCRAALSLDDKDLQNVSLSPNPSKGNVTLQAPTNEDVQISVFNILGNRVFKSHQALNSELNLNNLKTGVYLVKIEAKGKQTTKRLIIE